MQKIYTINDRAVWDAFFARVRPHTFLHTWEWGEFQESLGNRVSRVGLFENDCLVAIALLILIHGKKGTFALCPHGPLFANSVSSELTARIGSMLVFLKEYARKESCAYLRVAPLLLIDSKNDSIFEQEGFRDAPIHAHPQRAWILDIRPSQEELISSMRKTTRYSIRKAMKDGVSIRMAKNSSALKVFYDLYLATVARQRFTPFSYSYIKKELERFQGGHGSDAQIFLAEYKGEILAAAIVVFTSFSAFYHHGAASLIHPKIPASYLLQFEAIREAKRRDCEYYNFWGLAHKNPCTIFDQFARFFRSRHPWEGLTLFKTGFGGFEQNYIRAKDYVFSPWYWVTYGMESARRIKRGL